MHVRRSVVPVVAAAMMLSLGLDACAPEAGSSGSDVATETPTGAVESVEKPTAEEVAALPAEFTMPIGEGLELGDAREDNYLGQAVTDFDVSYEGPLTYQPIQVDGDAHWMTFDRSADYAQQGDYSVHESWPGYLVDRGMEASGRYAVETFMDSAAFYAISPEVNLEWLSENEPLFTSAGVEHAREDLEVPGAKWIILGANILDADGKDPEAEQNVMSYIPAYDLVPHRWSDINITVERAAGGGDENADYLYFEYYIEGNRLIVENQDGSYVPSHMPVRLRLGVELMSTDNLESWSVHNLRWTASYIGEPVEPWEDPWYTV